MMAPASPNEQTFRVLHETLSFSTAPKSTQMITRALADWLGEIGARSGTITAMCLHTSASLTMQENADPTVQDDILDYLDDIAPEHRPYVHSLEGPDDMPAHLKTMLTSASLTIRSMAPGWFWEPGREFFSWNIGPIAIIGACICASWGCATDQVA